MAKKMETQESEEEIRDAFKVFDKDNTGKLNRSDRLLIYYLLIARFVCTNELSPILKTFPFQV